uniref:Uncharacterized protein n=1 Tax=Romanomermis culicivorax TaxID=13658 RepID=A0A915IW64_ROMCU
MKPEETGFHKIRLRLLKRRSLHRSLQNQWSIVEYTADIERQKSTLMHCVPRRYHGHSSIVTSLPLDKYMGEPKKGDL